MAVILTQPTRRTVLTNLAKFAGGTVFARSLLWCSPEQGVSRYAPMLSVQTYIWLQHFASVKETLSEGVNEALRSIHQAGYRRVELTSDFLQPEVRERTVHLLAQYALTPETVYAGTTMHEANAAQKSIQEVVELARVLKPLRTRAMVTNPSPKPNQVRKSDEELNTQAHYVNQLGAELRRQGMKLQIHHHTPELLDNAREWRHLVQHMDPKLVSCCVDVHWAFRGGQDVMPFLREVGNRLASLHLRNSQHGVWMEDLGPGEVDYPQVVEYLHQIKYHGYLVVELAYEKNTRITRSLEEDLRLSRIYAEKVFGLRPS